MPILVMASLLFATALAVQAIVFRFRPPHFQRRALWILLATVPVAGVPCLHLVAPGAAPSTTSGVILGLIAYSGVALSWVNIQVVLENDSPSMTLVHNLAEAGPAGLSEEELIARVPQERFITRRLDAMVAEGMAKLGADGRYRIEHGRARGIVAFYVAYRRLARIRERGV